MILRPAAYFRPGFGVVPGAGVGAAPVEGAAGTVPDELGTRSSSARSRYSTT